MNELEILKAEIEGAKELLSTVYSDMETDVAVLDTSTEKLLARIETYDHVLKMISRMEAK